MYINWTHETHCHIKYTDYVYLDDVMKILQIARRIQFNNILHRNEICNLLLNINRFNIENDNRAPLKPFANISNSVFANLIEYIIDSLECSADDIYWDAIKKIYDLITVHLSLLYSSGIYTRTSFENKMVLEWCYD